MNAATGTGRVRVRELAAWGFDESPYRSEGLEPVQMAWAADDVNPAIRTSAGESAEVDGRQWEFEARFAEQAQRGDLLDEMRGLEWSLGVIDLRRLVAFQRRLFFPSRLPMEAAPAAGDAEGLMAYCFGEPKDVQASVEVCAGGDVVVVRAENPNVHVRVTGEAGVPLRLHAGGSFLEAAVYRERWFLRDGYHRAYRLLKAGVDEVPAVIVRAKTMEELGARQAWFFSEATLFSERPPMVVDFLKDHLTVEYERDELVKTIRIRIEEELAPKKGMGDRK